MQNAQWRMARCAWRWSQRRNSSTAVFAAVEPTTVVLAGTRRHLLTYASTGEHKFGAERLMASAVSRGGFHKTRICGPKNLDADFKKHNAHILKRWKGGGYWIYKSYILLQYQCSYGLYSYGLGLVPPSAAVSRSTRRRCAGMCRVGPCP